MLSSNVFDLCEKSRRQEELPKGYKDIETKAVEGGERKKKKRECAGEKKKLLYHTICTCIGIDR